MALALPNSSGSDQAARLRALAQRGPRGDAPLARSAGRVVAVTSGKGGVGKTNVAVNLAICLASRGFRTLLVDVDLGLANADILLNAKTRYTLADLATGARSLDEVTAEAPGRIHFISGGSGIESLVALSEFARERLLMQVRSARVPGAPRRAAAGATPDRPAEGARVAPDVIILDCAAGIAATVTTFALAADDIVVVTTPEPTAITDAYALVKVVRRAAFRGAVSLVVNMVESRAEARQVYERVAAVCDKFLGYPLADGGYLLQDMHVELAVRSRTPFVMRYPRSPASACMAAIAARLMRGRSRPAGQSGLLRRVAGLFI